jgi:hypothetical protein
MNSLPFNKGTDTNDHKTENIKGDSYSGMYSDLFLKGSIASKKENFWFKYIYLNWSLYR